MYTLPVFATLLLKTEFVIFALNKFLIQSSSLTGIVSLKHAVTDGEVAFSLLVKVNRKNFDRICKS